MSAIAKPVSALSETNKLLSRLQLSVSCDTV